MKLPTIQSNYMIIPISYASLSPVCCFFLEFDKYLFFLPIKLNASDVNLKMLAWCGYSVFLNEFFEFKELKSSGVGSWIVLSLGSNDSEPVGEVCWWLVFLKHILGQAGQSDQTFLGMTKM